MRRTAMALCAGAIFATPARAVAQEAEEEPISHRDIHRFESPQHYAFELRFGPYRPNIDDEFPAMRPYASVFGDDHRLMIGLEFDWQALRIPHFGSLGPGIGWGYTHMSAPAKLELTGGDSAEETTLAIMPWYAVAVLRVDMLARDTAVPLVPYAKAGVGYALWWTGNDLGTSTAPNGQPGRGTTWGTHFALGGMLLLDAFDEHSAVQLDNEMGINNSYVFFEWMLSNLDGFGAPPGQKLHVGASTWVLGLALEM